MCFLLFYCNLVPSLVVFGSSHTAIDCVMSATKAWAATGPTAPLAPFEVVRRELAEDDVGIAINWAGICHSDIHQARGEWGGSSYPMVPGHEIGGLVTAVGAKVTTLKVGDSVGVGCMVDSCR